MSRSILRSCLRAANFDQNLLLEVATDAAVYSGAPFFFSPLGGGPLRKMSFDVSSVWSLRTRANHQTSKISLLGKMNDAATPCQTYLYCFTNARAVTPGWLHKHIGFEFDLISYEFIAAPSIHCIILSFKK